MMKRDKFNFLIERQKDEKCSLSGEQVLLMCNEVRLDKLDVNASDKLIKSSTPSFIVVII